MKTACFWMKIGIWHWDEVTRVVEVHKMLITSINECYKELRQASAVIYLHCCGIESSMTTLMLNDVGKFYRMFLMAIPKSSKFITFWGIKHYHGREKNTNRLCYNKTAFLSIDVETPTTFVNLMTVLRTLQSLTFSKNV